MSKDILVNISSLQNELETLKAVYKTMVKKHEELVSVSKGIVSCIPIEKSMNITISENEELVKKLMIVHGSFEKILQEYKVAENKICKVNITGKNSVDNSGSDSDTSSPSKKDILND